MKKINCFNCNRENISHNEVGLCKKLLGRSIEKFMCIDCLAEYLEITTEELLEKIDEFKAQGCTLFN